MAWPIRMFRLVSERGEPGLYCGNDGLALGGAPLLERGAAGFEPRRTDELDTLFGAAYGADTDISATSRLAGLRSVANALNKNDLSRAMIASLMLNLPDIDDDGVTRLNEFQDTFKFNDAEPRNWRGRWTTGESGNSNLTPVQMAIPFPIPGPLVPGTYGAPKPKDDDACPVVPPVTTDPSANSNSLTDSHAVANDNKPQACPDPSWEPDSIKRTREQLLYQAQINKLPLGWHVLLNGYGYDGCRESDQTMLEAKSGRTFLLTLPDYLRPIFDEYKDTMLQAFRQNYNSDGRRVEWHFSNPDAADYWSREFKKAGYENISVKFTPYDERHNHNLIRYDRIASAHT